MEPRKPSNMTLMLLQVWEPLDEMIFTILPALPFWEPYASSMQHHQTPHNSAPLMSIDRELKSMGSLIWVCLTLPPVQENPICTVYDRQAPSLLGHPCTSTRHPAPPLWTCLPVRKPFFILIQICLLALFPLWPSSALCSNIEQESVGVAWFHFGSLDIVLQDLLPFSPSTAFYLPTAQGLCSPAPSTIL